MVPTRLNFRIVVLFDLPLPMPDFIPSIAYFGFPLAITRTRTRLQVALTTKHHPSTSGDSCCSRDTSGSRSALFEARSKLLLHHGSLLLAYPLVSSISWLLPTPGLCYVASAIACVQYPSLSGDVCWAFRRLHRSSSFLHSRSI